MTSEDAGFRLAAGVSWVVQEAGVLVIDELARRSVLLSYPQAAVWDLLARGCDRRCAAGMLRWILAVDAPEADGQVKRCLEEWIEAGWMEPVDDGTR